MPSPSKMQVDDDDSTIPFNVDDAEPDQGIEVEELRIPLSAAPASGLLERATQEPFDCYRSVHANAAVRAICLLLLHMHARYQLPHLACAFLATMLYAVLRFFLLLPDNSAYSKATAPPRTLNTMYKRLGLWDRFDVKTLCPICWEFERFEDEQRDVDLLDELGLEDEDGIPEAPEDWQRYCPRCKESLYVEAPKSGVPRARRQAPYDLLSLQLAEFLGQPGFEDACESYLDQHASPNTFSSIQDGSVWQELQTPDSALFFPRSRAEALEQDELRLGILVSMDWFDPSTSSVSESHSVDFASLTSVSSAFSPAPANPTQNSFNASSAPSSTTFCASGRMESSLGRLIVLKAAESESPCSALSAITLPSARCPASQTTDTALVHARKGIPARDGELHKRRAARMHDLGRDQSKPSKRAMDRYFKRYGVRWSEFCRLRYFKPVMHSVIDPMHAILQGLTKTQWYYVWVLGGKQGIKVLREGTEAGTRRELDEIHEILARFEIPGWYARLPSQVGYPAGGSLTSDEWCCLAVLYGPAAIPPILLKASKELPPKKTQKKRSATQQQEPQAEDAQTPRVHPAAAQNYLKLATVVKIYLRREITEADLARASALYSSFFAEFVEIYGAANVTPTFHWITHMPEQIRRYGPVHGFWTFLFERLNKVLKGFQTNGHKGGVTEITFAREFKREMSLGRINNILAHQEKDLLARLVAIELQSRARDVARTGTLAAIATEAQDNVDAQIQDQAHRSCYISGAGKRRFLDRALLDQLLSWYQQMHGDLSIRHPGDSTAPRGSRFISNQAMFYPELLLEGQRIIAVDAEKQNKSQSLILLRFRPGVQWVGELREVFQHHQAGIAAALTFAVVSWLVPLQDAPEHAELYRGLPELEVDFWQHGRYQEENDLGPDSIILAQDICGMAARCEMTVNNMKIWITTGLSKSGISL
ncbi:hypothetical protein CALVIDRAFT_568941 [Calocera viscosa TUFC12733]|uniref:Uncharacterized protein n=1 Tax=Calocera viscosa (strain TUFC12733) TaxID=1330018 RepID=A0A167GIV2_CALVF|nr:hypothetical protein CALVIDRAFT_568941 [Calocera viscosa TUFC12733]